MSGKGNEDLYKEVIDKISKLHDREINLLQSDHEEFMNYLNKTGKGRKLKFPIKDPPLMRRSLSSKVEFTQLIVTGSSIYICPPFNVFKVSSIFKKNSKTNNTSIESPNIELFESGKKLGVAPSWRWSHPLD